MKKYIIYEEKTRRVVYVEQTASTVFEADVRRQRYSTRDLNPHSISSVAYRGETIHTDAKMSFRQGSWLSPAVFSLAAAKLFLAEYKTLRWPYQSFVKNGNPWRPAFRIVKLIVHPNMSQSDIVAQKSITRRSMIASQYLRAKRRQQALALLEQVIGPNAGKYFTQHQDDKL